MTSTWGTLTIGASPVRITTTSTLAGKLRFQPAPGATGAIKVGGAGLTADTTTPGFYLNATAGTNPDTSAQVGQTFELESNAERNTIDISTFYVHGSHSGDKVDYFYMTI